MFIYQHFASISLTVNCILLLVVGVLVNGPYALITTAVSAELGTHSSVEGNSKALATVTAIIDGTGSIGHLGSLNSCSCRQRADIDSGCFRRSCGPAPGRIRELLRMAQRLLHAHHIRYSGAAAAAQAVQAGNEAVPATKAPHSRGIIK